MSVNGNITNVEFASLKLRAGSWLQLQKMAGGGMKFDVEFAGVIPGKCLFLGIQENLTGQAHLKAGDQYQVRGFNGVSDFTFRAEILEVRQVPFEHVYITYPESVEAKVVRETKRLKTALPAVVKSKDAVSSTPSVIKDLSIEGALIESATPVGEVGDQVEISISTQFENKEVQLKITAKIRHLGKPNSANNVFSSGVEFEDISKPDKPILYYLLFRLAEDES